MGRDTLIEEAWKIYCDETKGDMHVADFFQELPSQVKDIYLRKAERRRAVLLRLRRTE